MAGLWLAAIQDAVAGGWNPLDLSQDHSRVARYNCTVNSRSYPLKLMHGLALLAALLLAFAPSISRVSLPFGGQVAEALCTSEGLKSVELPLDGRAPGGQASHADCGYCALLESTPPAIPSLAMSVPSLSPAMRAIAKLTAPHLAKFNLPALGSRGPPALQ